MSKQDLDPVDYVGVFCFCFNGGGGRHAQRARRRRRCDPTVAVVLLKCFVVVTLIVC